MNNLRKKLGKNPFMIGSKVNKRPRTKLNQEGKRYLW
jgi:hypothetical protein